MTNWKRFVRVFFGRKVVLFSLIVLVLLILMAIFAPLLAPYGPNVLYAKLVLSLPSRAPSTGWAPTPWGRDTLSSIIYGGRVSLVIGLAVVFISSISGMVLGLFAGYYRWAQTPIMWVMDALMAFPMVVLTMAIAAMLAVA